MNGLLEFLTARAGRREAEFKSKKYSLAINHGSENLREEEIKVKRKGCPFLNKKKEN